MDILEKFGNKVKLLRLEKGLSQEALAHKADIDRTYLPGIEKGTRNSSIKVANQIAITLEVTLSELLNFEV
ncbi:helix-turn-helix domain-containing protein [bacterium]|nr:helix-turn-helix domain-containing protein [bacterium]